MENFDTRKFVYTMAIAILIALAAYFGYPLDKGSTNTNPTPSPTLTATAQPTITPTATPTVTVQPTPTSTATPVVGSFSILDSYERVEYASASDFKSSASVKLSMGEPIGYIVKLANDTQMPTGNFTKLYKMVSINISTPSYTGGKTGAFYDAMVPLLQSNLAGTQYIYAEYIAPNAAGTYAIALKQGDQSITLNATVIANTLKANTIPMYILVGNSYLTMGHYGKYVNGSESLGIPYLKEAVAHRITPYNSGVIAPLVTNGMLDYNNGGSNSFQKNVLDFVPQGFMMPNYSNQASLQAAEATVKAKGQSAWFYTKDEPCSPTTGCTGTSDVASTNTLLALQKQYAPSIKTMVTTSSLSGINPDIFCPVIDHFAVQTYTGGPVMPGESAYAGKDLWLYTSCMEHGCGVDRAGNVGAAKVSGGATGAPGFALDHPAAYVYGFILAPLRYKSVKALLYYNSVEQYKLYPQGVDPWTDQFNFGGNGDGTLFYPQRVGMFGATAEAPAVSIRMKQIRTAEYIMDYAQQAPAQVSACGGDKLMTDSLHFEKDSSKYRAFRDCLIQKMGF